MNNILFLVICIFGSLNSKNAYDYLLEWGLNNSLMISNKLGMRYTNENNKTYFAKEEIPENTIIMNIPFKIMLNVENALKLFNNKKINKLYNDYKKNEFKITVGYLPPGHDQSFLTYLIYLANSGKKKYQNSKFYQYFQYLFDTFETNLDKFPMFYNLNQLKLLNGSVSLMEVLLMKELYKEETEILEEKHKQKNIDYDEYVRFRTLAVSKSLNISNISSIIPFFDMFESDPIDYNVNFRLNETDKSLFLFTTKKVKRDDILYIRSGQFSNIMRFVLYGETFEKMKDEIKSYKIPMISNVMLSTLQQNEVNQFNLDDTIELISKKFYKKALKSYKKLSLIKKGDGSELSAYKLFLKNLEMAREIFNKVTTSNIHKEFVDMRNIYNVKRILDFEKDLFDKKMEVLRKYIKKLEKTNDSNSANKINKDL